MPVNRSVQWLLALAAGSYVVSSQADALSGFDTETLRLRGIDPQLAAYLAESERFTAGEQPIQLKINGQSRGRVDARFDSNGALCFDPEWLNAAGLHGSASARDDCQGFMEDFPETQIELRPALGEVELWVPSEAVVAAPAVLGDFSVGGAAGLFNYDLQGVFSEFDRQNSQFWSANTEVGFNAGDWIVRSRQLYANSDGRSRNQHLDAYAQRTFAEQQAVLQLGQISLFNPVLSGARIEGAQWGSEPALRQSEGSGRLGGIAATRARIEVHQAGSLIYSTVVPAGPFELSNIAQLDIRRDVQLTIIEANGERQTVTVLASTLGASLPASGFSVGAGQVRGLGGLRDSPWVASASWSQPLTASSSISNGLLLADGYQALGSGLAGSAWRGGRWQATLQGSHVERARRQGVQARLGLHQTFGTQWRANFSYAQQTAGHRELADTLLDQLDSHYRFQYSLGLGWNHARLGGLDAGYAESTLFDQRRSGRAYASWSRQWGRASFSLNADWQLAGEGGLGNALYLSASLPLGERRRVRATVRHRDGQQRLGVSLQEQVNERVSYRLGGERTSHAQPLDFNASVSLLPGATQLDLGYASYGGGNQSYNLGARGGVMAHAEGVTLSAYPLQDTFALLSLGDDAAGIQVETPGGAVWTDRNGRAVIAHLSAYGQSNVEVVTRSLPRNVDIRQGAAQIRAGRGAVPSVHLSTQTTRRALLTALDLAQKPLPPGALVLGEGGALITLVQGNGLIFVPNVLDHPRLWVQMDGQPPCELHFELPSKADTQAYFENAAAVCRAS